MSDLSWTDEFLPSLEGIRLKEFQRAGGSPGTGMTFKQWVTIHGHPVNIGGNSGGSSGGGGHASGKKDGPLHGGNTSSVGPANGPDASAVADLADMMGKMKGRGGIRSKLDFDKGKFTVTVAKNPYKEEADPLPEGWHTHLERAGLPMSAAKVSKGPKGGFKYEWDV